MYSTWLFDIDGTLIRAGGAGSLAMSRALSEVFRVGEAGGNLKNVTFAGRTDRAITLDIFAVHDIEASESNVTAFYECYLNHLPISLEQCDGEVLPGVLSLIGDLEAAGRTVGLITGNMEPAARIKLRHFGLDHHFAFGGFGGDHQDRDDVAAMAVSKAKQRQLEQRVSKPFSGVVIGDTPNDVSCARSQGLDVIAVATGSYSLEELRACDPDLYAQDLVALRTNDELLP